MNPRAAAEAARGWVELPAARTHPDVFCARLRIATSLRSWEMGEELLRLLEDPPNAEHRSVCAAFCHARARSLCTGGEVMRARGYVKKASNLCPALRQAMMDDPVLSPLWCPP